jgi:hypothetical protein
MNETEVRSRLREAFGDVDYPPALKTSVEARLGRPATRSQPSAIGIIAALLAVLIVASLVYVRVQSTRSVRPVAHPSPVATPQSQIANEFLVGSNLDAAAGVITRLNLSQTKGDRTMGIVAAYADPTETVVITRAQPPFPALEEVAMDISDDLGLINAPGSGWAGRDGYGGYIVLQGPHSGPDRIAHLQVRIVDVGIPFFFRPTPTTQILPASSNPVSPSPEIWDFSFDVKVQPAVPLTMQTPLTSVGAWQFTVEVFELTPARIYFQGLVRDATGFDPFSSITLLDEAGNPPIGGGGSYGPETDTPGSPMRFKIYWARPAYATTLQLRISYGSSAASSSRPGSQYTTSVSIPPPPRS